jgi:RNA-directed DNA polymerase
MSLQTPDNIRRLQRKLYLKAKAEPDYRFYRKRCADALV